MTLKQIEERQRQMNVKFEAAKKIRQILDEARKSYGTKEWDDEDAQQEVLDLVTEETSE